MRMPTRRALVASFVLLLTPRSAWAEPPIAAAQEPTDEDLIAKGIELRKQGLDAEALATFERAHARRPSPRTAAQIALAHHALAHWREAEHGLVDALHDSDDPWIARNRVYLEESLSVVQAHLAWLEVESNVAGAEVWMDGELHGRLPLEGPLRIVAGEVAVKVRAPGYPAIERTLQVAAKSHLHEAFTFVVQPAPEPGSDTNASAIPRAPVEHPTSSIRSAGWITLAGSGALVLVGIGGVVTREWEAGIWNDDSQCAPPAGQSRYARCGTSRDIGSAAQAIAVAAFVGAGISGAVSGLLLLGSSRSAAAPAGHVACRVGVPGFACGGVF
jgi:hypothetical protein